MGFMDFLRRMFKKKQEAEALQSASKRSEALQSAAPALQNEGLERSTEPPQTTSKISSPSIELQRDSLQLGIAAGYTGRYLRDIESTLQRMESQIITKEWFLNQFQDLVQKFSEALREHDQNEEKRFEKLQNLIASIRGTAERAPEPFRTELFAKIHELEAHLPLTPKVKKTLSLIKEAGEISYKDLAEKLNLTPSGVRALLTNMVKRTKEIERFEKDGQGWVRYKGEALQSASERSPSDVKPEGSKNI